MVVWDGGRFFEEEGFILLEDFFFVSCAAWWWCFELQEGGLCMHECTKLSCLPQGENYDVIKGQFLVSMVPSL